MHSIARITPHRRAWSLALVALLLATGFVTTPRQALAAGVVGNGTPQSCNHAAFAQALQGGGTVSFNCGGAVTIPITEKTISVTTTINGGGLITLSGRGTNRLFTVNASRRLTLLGITLVSGNAGPTQSGGAIVSSGTLELSGVTMVGNVAHSGGAIASSDGTLRIIGSTLVSNNAAGSAGVGGHVFAVGTTVSITDSTLASGIAAQSMGGAVYHESGDLSITRSTIAGNFAQSGGGITFFGADGDDLTVTNSTISANRAVTTHPTCCGTGGGILTGTGGTRTLNQVTITGNTATRDSAGLAGGPFHTANSILAGNMLADGTPSDCEEIASRGYNLIGSTAGCAITGDTTGNVTGQNPRLLPLTRNGGPTSTHPLDIDSPALDAGNPSATPPAGQVTCTTTDQRGIARPQHDRCDIGAYETRLVTVGTGTSSSCTNTGYENAMAVADMIRFECGTGHVLFVPEQQITRTLVLDGRAGELGLSGNANNRLFRTSSTGHLVIYSLELRNGASAEDGGAIFNDGMLTIRDSDVHSSVARDGGAIANDGTALIERTYFYGNRARRGGAIAQLGGRLTLVDSSIEQNEADANGSGAGIHVAGGTVAISSTTVYFNHLLQGFGGGLGISGGAVTIGNSMIIGNTAGSDDLPGSAGAGVVITGGSLDLNNVSIHNNVVRGTTPFGAAGLYVGASGVVTLGNTLLANNRINTGSTSLDCRAPSGNPLQSRGYNLVENVSGCAIGGDTTGNLTGDPGPFTLVLGPRPFVLTPEPDNRVLDAGNPAAPESGPGACLATDARGFSRTHDARCDIGAVERDQVPAISRRSMSPVPNAQGWHRQDVTVTFEGEDDPGGIGFSHIHASFNGAANTTQLFFEPVSTYLHTVEGITTITFSARDLDGSQETPRILRLRLDKTNPVMDSGPTVAFPLGQQMPETGTIPLLVNGWSGQDVGPSGLGRYRLERRVNSQAFTVVALPTPQATEVRINALAGTRVRFRARAFDVAGNGSAFAATPEQTLTRRQENPAAGVLVYSAGWTARSRADALGGTLRDSSTAGSTATYTFTGTDIAWIGAQGPGRGTANVYLDGGTTPVATVDLDQPTEQSRVMLWVASGLAAGTHTVRIEVVDGLVEVDGFVTLD